MVTVAEADQILQSVFRQMISIQTRSTYDCVGAVLRENVLADRDFPPFPRAMMDGIAIRFADFATGLRIFPLIGRQLAGQAPMSGNQPGDALEIMTGAYCPETYDTIIRYEDLRIDYQSAPPVASVLIEDVQQGQNIHPQGFDQTQGAVLLTSGKRLTAAEIAVALSVGKTSLQVSTRPRVALISTGDELVAPEQQPAPFQIRRSNVFALATLLQAQYFDSQVFHLRDDKALMKKDLAPILDTFEVVVCSGAVSKGQTDFLPQVLEELGVEKLFHQVAQRPGKPFWAGKRQQTMVFALPGNPVSTFLGGLRYVIPYLQRLVGLPTPLPIFVRLAEPVSFKPVLTYFLPAQISSSAQEGVLWATPYKGNGSGDFANLIHVDGFVELPADRQHFEAGEVFPWWPFRG